MIRLTKKTYFDKSLLKTLVCPITKKNLYWDKKNNTLISKEGNLTYPIVNGIPVLLKKSAKKLK